MYDEPCLAAKKSRLKTYHDGMSDEVHRVGGTALGWAADRLHETEGFNELADRVIGKIVCDLHRLL